ncbi:MAG TPA: glycosyltransferase family 9 protein [bacterium]|nr:glycosyltransferase family 9 protein [bacterium]
MRILSFKRPVKVQRTVVPAQRGHVWPDGFARWCRAHHAELIEEDRPLIAPWYRPYRGQDLTDKSILLWRSGGFGDILFLTPLLRELKKRHPTATVAFATAPAYQIVLRHNRDVDRILPLPVSDEQLAQYDFHLHFEGTIEAAKDPQLHAVDLMAARAGMTVGEKLPVYAVAPALGKAIKDDFFARVAPVETTKLIAVQAAASSQVRTYPPPKLAAIVEALAAAGHCCLIFGLARHRLPLREDLKRVIDLTGKTSMELATAMLSFCDLLIAPDSSLVHFAAALNVPTVALYGPFPGTARTRYYPLCVTLEAQRHCAPCFLHGDEPCPWAQRRSQCWSPCFDSLPPDLIVETAQRHLTRMC